MVVRVEQDVLPLAAVLVGDESNPVPPAGRPLSAPSLALQDMRHYLNTYMLTLPRVGRRLPQFLSAPLPAATELAPGRQGYRPGSKLRPLSWPLPASPPRHLRTINNIYVSIFRFTLFHQYYTVFTYLFVSFCNNLP